MSDLGPLIYLLLDNCELLWYSLNMAKNEFPSEENLRTTSRDLLRAYKYALDNPNKSLISTSKFGEVLGLQGRALGGVLAGAGKVAHAPILIRQGVAKTSWSGKYESREQLWSINPEIPKRVLNALKDLLAEMNLDIYQIRCPRCGNVGAERVHRGVGAAGENKRLPDNTYRCRSCRTTFSEKDLKR